MSNKPRKLSKKQVRFIDAAERWFADNKKSNRIVSREDIDAIAKLADVNFPQWLTRPENRLQRGIYRVPMIEDVIPDGRNADEVLDPSSDPSAATMKMQAAGIADMVEAVEAVVKPSVVSYPVHPGSPDIPDRISSYVPFGHYHDVKKILESGIFLPIYITGLSGNGKTTMVEQICAELGRELFRVNITAQTDEFDLIGHWKLEDGNTRFEKGPVVKAIERGAVLLLDEVDLATPNIMCLQPVLEGKGVYIKKTKEWIRPMKGFTVVSTGNTKGQGSDSGKFIGTNVLNEAFIDRLTATTFEQDYPSLETEKEIVLKLMAEYGKVDEDFAEILVQWGNSTRKTFADGGCEEIITTRRLVNVVSVFSIFGDRAKAVQMAISRYDEMTRDSFMSLYKALDAKVEAAAAERKKNAKAVSGKSKIANISPSYTGGAPWDI